MEVPWRCLVRDIHRSKHNIEVVVSVHKLGPCCELNPATPTRLYMNEQFDKEVWNSQRPSAPTYTVFLSHVVQERLLSLRRRHGHRPRQLPGGHFCNT